MQYIFLKPKFHIFLDKVERNAVEFEFVYSHGGSWYENEPDFGKTHLLEHVICSRTQNLDFNQFKTFTFENSIKYNAFTSPSSLGLEMSGHKNNFKEMFDTLFEMFTNPTLTQEDLDREKEIVLSEILERRGDPQYRLYYDVSRKILTPNSFSNHEVLGKSEMVKNTTLLDLKRIFANIKNRSQFVLCISGGGIDEKYIREKIENLNLENGENYGENCQENLQEKSPFAYNFKNELLTFENEVIVHKDGHEECELTFYIPVEVTFENRGVREIFTHLYLRWSGHGLYDLLRDKHGLIYGYHFAYDIYGQILNIELNCHLKDVKKIINLIQDFFSDFDKIFDKTQFNALKSQLLIKQDLTKDKLGAQASFSQNMLLTYGRVDNYENLIQDLEKVSECELKNFFEKVGWGVQKMKVLAVSQKPEAVSLFEKKGKI